MRSRGRRTLFVAALGSIALAAVSCRTPVSKVATNGAQRPVGVIVLPVRWDGEYVFLEGTVDGEGPYTFLLDTGAGCAVVSPRVLAGYAGRIMTHDEGTSAIDSAGKSVPLRERIRVDSLRVGPAEFRGLDANVMDLEAVSNGFGSAVDGVVGLTAFPHGLLTIDYPAREVRFAEGELGPVDGRTILPLVFEQSMPSVDLGWEDGTVRVILDSGNNGGIDLGALPPGAPLLCGPAPARHSLSLSGLSGWIPFVRIGGRFRIGKFVIRDPVVSLREGPSLVGTEILRHFRLTFDAAHAKVRMDGAEEEVTMDPVRGIGAGILPSGGSWRVADVLPGSPAERSGLRAGDLVRSVDGVPADAAHGAALVAALRKTGVAVRVAVRRDGKDLEFEVPVVDLVR